MLNVGVFFSEDEGHSAGKPKFVRLQKGSISSTLRFNWMFGLGDFGLGMGCKTCEL